MPPPIPSPTKAAILFSLLAPSHPLSIKATVLPPFSPRSTSQSLAYIPTSPFSVNTAVLVVGRGNLLDAKPAGLYRGYGCEIEGLGEKGERGAVVEIGAVTEEGEEGGGESVVVV
jgi:hypothetical protein